MSEPPVDPHSPEAAERALAAGGIPPIAAERLRALAASEGRFFTSDLSTSEFLLVRQAGFRPLTQVMGSCFYNVGWQSLPYAGGWGYGASQSYELDVQTEAWNEARRLAISRLAQEATLAGADAVLGVSITRGNYDWAQGLIEFVAVGTAVACDAYELGDEIVLSSLSGQEITSLVRSGWMPVGVVAGSTVVYVLGGYQTMQAMSGYGAQWRNTELRELSLGLAGARRAAMRRVERQAHAAQRWRHRRARDGPAPAAARDRPAGPQRLDLIVTFMCSGRRSSRSRTRIGATDLYRRDAQRGETMTETESTTPTTPAPPRASPSTAASGSRG